MISKCDRCPWKHPDTCRICNQEKTGKYLVTTQPVDLDEEPWMTGGKRPTGTDTQEMTVRMFMHKVWYERPVTKEQLRAKLVDLEIRPIGKN